MAKARKFFHTILKVEFLSPEPLDSGDLDQISDHIRDAFEGVASVAVETDTENCEVGRNTACRILRQHDHEGYFNT